MPAWGRPVFCADSNGVWPHVDGMDSCSLQLQLYKILAWFLDATCYPFPRGLGFDWKYEDVHNSNDAVTC